MLRIALVTYGGGHEDLIATEKPLIDAFAAIGPYTASMHVWSDASVQWRDFDVVLVRCTWDYHKRLPEFVAWLRRVDAVLPGRLLNPVSTLVWNMDKAYLVELRDSHPGVVHIANSVIVSPPSLDGAWTAEQLRCVCDHILSRTIHSCFVVDVVWCGGGHAPARCRSVVSCRPCYWSFV